MRYSMTLLLSLIAHFLLAQIKGDGNVITTTYALSDIQEIEIGLYAEVVINASAVEESLTISIDKNLLDLVGRKLEHGRLTLDQKKWLSASKTIQIKINAPNLDFIQQSTHETTIVKGIKKSSFSATANVGKIILNGEATTFRASGEVGTVDATALNAEEVNVNLWSWGKIMLDTPKKITGKVKDRGKVIYNGNTTTVNVKTNSEGSVMSANELTQSDWSKHKYIDVKIKNNSNKRLNAYVRGPKSDGSFFSYGFPMRPNQIKSERWTVGTKVFRKTALGKRELVELTAEDEGTIVTLY